MKGAKATIYYAGFRRFGGVFSHVTALAGELQKSGYHVAIVTLDSLPWWCRYLPHLVEKVVNAINRPLGFLYKDRTTGALYKRFFAGRTTHLNIFEDIYIGWNSATPSVSVLHAVWSDNLQSHMVGDEQKAKLVLAEEMLINGLQHPVATVSAPYAKYLMGEHFSGRLSKRIDVIELGIDHHVFREGDGRASKSIVYVGALEERKNVSFLLEVFRRLIELDCAYQLTIVGDGPQRASLRGFVERHGLDVRFVGALPHDRVVAELQRHSLYMHTSVKESFSYALLEAKLAGLTTLAHRGLQVPPDFIDVSLDSFDVDEWVDNVRTAVRPACSFDRARYTSRRMMLATLRLAGVAGE